MKLSAVARNFQLTLAILKPHITTVPGSMQGIYDSILINGFYIVKSKNLTFTQSLAEEFYSEHKEKFFYNRLITHMCSDQSRVLVLGGEDAIHAWRELMGPTKVYQAQFTDPETVRGTHGLSDTLNATHGSDSPEAARKEIKLSFPDFDMEKWMKEELPYFKDGNVIFSDDEGVHVKDIISRIRNDIPFNTFKNRKLVLEQ